MTPEVKEPAKEPADGSAKGPAGADRPLAWLGEVLGWTFASPGAPTPGGRQYWALPSREKARIVVPKGTAARGALSSVNDSMTQLARLKKAALGFSLGLGTPWVPGADKVVVTSRGPGGDGDTIERLIERVIGAPGGLGVALGPSLRPNRKPVLQIVDRRGRIVAFAKVGWNDHTRALVDAESRALSRLADQPLSFQIPELLSHDRWHGRIVMVVSAGPTSVLRKARRNEPPPVSAELDVARSGWWSQQQLAPSPYLTDLRTRLEHPDVTSETGERMLACLEVIARRRGGARTAFGAWHGDWAPWNMIRSRAGLFVLDWERYAGPVPVGFDHLHLRFQLAHQVAGDPIDTAAACAVDSLRAVAGPLGIDPDAAPSLLALYLMERALRVEMGNAAGMSTRDSLVSTILTYVEEACR